MLEARVIEPSKSPWSSPIHVVRKKEGSIHICVDYRCLNAVTSYDPYQIQRVGDLIDKIGNATYLSKLDLTKGYYQVPVAEKDHDKIAFVTPFGKFQYVTMTYGLKGAPATFQWLMDQLLDGLQDHCLAYFDDIMFSAQPGKTTLNTFVPHLK